jgi:hypothetical protein
LLYIISSTLFFGSCYGDFDPVAEKVSGNLLANYTIDSLIKTHVSPIGDLPTPEIITSLFDGIVSTLNKPGIRVGKSPIGDT